MYSKPYILRIIVPTPSSVKSSRSNACSIVPSIICTLCTPADTASSADFQSKLRNLPNILFVADEVHSLGSRKISSILENNFGFRLGLSATPERYRDPEGTDKIFGFFNIIFTYIDRKYFQII